MKKKYFLLFWAVLLVICVGVGVITRMSFTSIPTDTEHMASLPWSYPYNAELYHEMDDNEKRSHMVAYQLKINAGELLSRADCVIAGEFTGNRQAVNRGFLSDFQVSRVFQGDPALEGKVVRVYEPFAYRNTGGEVEHFSSTSQLTMMVPDTEYLLLLAPRVLPEGMEMPAVPEFTYIEQEETYITEDGGKCIAIGCHPYAKFILFTDDLCKPAPGNLTAGQSVKYECLLPDEELCRQFIQMKHTLLGLFGEEGI